MPKKTDNGNGVKLAVVGVSLAAAAATAYFFFGPKGKQHRQHAKAWAIKMKGDVVEKLERAKEITEPVYHEIIDAVSKDYAKGKKASQIEIKEMANDLKKHWKSISKIAIAAKQGMTKDASKAVKTAKNLVR